MQYKSSYLKRIRHIWQCCLLTCLICLPTHAKTPQNIGAMFLEHIEDAHSWHFATINDHHIVLPLPIILYSSDRGIECFLSSHFYNAKQEKIPFRGYYIEHESIKCLDPSRSIYDLSITKNITAMFISVLLLVSVALYIAKRYKQDPLGAPKGICSFMELIINFVKYEIAIPNIGQKHYERFLPYLLTTFLFIWLNNILGLFPGGANVTGNIAVTLVLAAFTILITLFNGNKLYWSHMFKPQGVPKWLFPIMIPVEILGIFTKFFSLMIRLFANITAGHIILLSIIGLVFIMGNIYIGLGISVPFGTFMLILKILVSVLQAYVFTLLSAIYFGQAVSEKHH